MAIMTIDFNADLGEAMGHDEALMKLITSANICCGYHAGSPAESRRALALAAQMGCSYGFHPGYDDAAHFGRRRLSLSNTEITALITCQITDMLAHCKALSLAPPRYLKLHGALANQACQDADLATLCFDAAKQAAGASIALYVIAASAQVSAAQKIGLPFFTEIYADRGYDETGQLLARSHKDALITDEKQIIKNMLSMLKAGAILSASGKLIPTPIDTICLHGDNHKALTIAKNLRAALLDHGYQIKAPF